MQNSLKLKTYEDPRNLAEAKEVIQKIVSDAEATEARLHSEFKRQVTFLKQQYKIALRKLRPSVITEDTLRELFDESEFVDDPCEETSIEDEDEEKSGKGKKTRKKKNKAIPDHLPRTVVTHDVGEDQKICKQDGTALGLMGHDVKLELKYTRAKFEVIEHRYPKYSCGICKEGIVRQKPEPALIPKSYVSPELLAHIAVAKFCDHLPLYRQEKIYRRSGVFLTRQVMADWMIKLGTALNPLIGLMHEKILESPVVSADETPVRLLTKEGVRTSTQAYMWQLSRWGPNPLVFFEFDPSRKKEVAERLLGTYEGYVQIDGYSGYNILFDEKSPRKRVGCMAHVVRKFKDLLKSLPKDQRGSHPAKKIVEMIDDLYHIEEQCRGILPASRKSYRLESDAGKKFEQLAEFIVGEKLAISKSSPYYAPLNYAHDELPHIARYLDHGAIELDNNLAENAIRPFAVGRRNWLFICTEGGAQASANIYSLLITAKANDIEPLEYLTYVIRRLPRCESIEDYEMLLPQ